MRCLAGRGHSWSAAVFKWVRCHQGYLLLWLIHVTSTEIHMVLKKNALFRCLFFGMVNSYISANVNTVYPQQRKRVSLYVEPDTHLFARLRRKRKLFHSSGLTLSVSGMCFSLTMFTNEWPNGVQQRTLVAVFDLRSTRSEEVQRTHLDHERLKD